MKSLWSLDQDPVPEATLQGFTHILPSPVWDSVSAPSYINTFELCFCCVLTKKTYLEGLQRGTEKYLEITVIKQNIFCGKGIMGQA